MVTVVLPWRTIVMTRLRPGGNGDLHGEANRLGWRDGPHGPAVEDVELFCKGSRAVGSPLEINRAVGGKGDGLVAGVLQAHRVVQDGARDNRRWGINPDREGRGRIRRWAWLRSRPVLEGADGQATVARSDGAPPAHRIADGDPQAAPATGKRHGDGGPLLRNGGAGESHPVVRLPIDLRIRDACAGNVRLDIGGTRLDQDRVGRHALGDRGRQRNLVSGAVEQLDRGHALQDARAGGSVAKQDRRCELAAGQGTDPSEDGAQISRLAGAASNSGWR